MNHEAAELLITDDFWRPSRAVAAVPCCASFFFIVRFPFLSPCKKGRDWPRAPSFRRFEPAVDVNHYIRVRVVVPYRTVGANRTESR